MSNLNDGYDQPHQVSDIQVALPADLNGLLPPWTAIPEDFRRDEGKARPWRRLQADWFFRGISKSAVVPRPDVDAEKAWRHLGVIQGSWDPKHEHKMAAVAWLMSRWFKAVAK